MLRHQNEFNGKHIQLRMFVPVYHKQMIRCFWLIRGEKTTAPLPVFHRGVKNTTCLDIPTTFQRPHPKD